MRREAIAAFAGLCLMGMAACATPTVAPAPHLQLIALLAGDYASMPSDGAREGRAIYMRARPVAGPDGASLALYMELRHDGPEGEFYRQRLYVFAPIDREDRIVMRALSFADPAAAAALITSPDLVGSGKIKTVGSALGPGCDTVWRRDGDGFLGVVDPALCLITGKRGDQRRIEAVTRIAAGAIEQLERGFDLDGNLLFGDATGARAIWPRVR